MDPILQACGLGKDQETGQNLYKTHYYLEKVHDVLHYFLFLIYGDDIPEDLRNAFGLFSKQRWLTQERQCLKAWRCLCIRATIKLLSMIATLYGGEHTFEYQEAIKLCVCVDDPSAPSAFILVILLICNHCGSKDSDSAKNLAELVTFYCSPLHRISIAFGADIYPVHKRFLAFVDSPSERESNAGKIKTISTREIEFGIYHREMILWYYKYRSNIKSALSQHFVEYVEKESKRAVGIIEGVTDDKTCSDWFYKKARHIVKTPASESVPEELLLDQVGINSLAMAIDKFSSHFIGPGHILAVLPCPFLGPHAAHSILRALLDTGNIHSLVMQRIISRFLRRNSETYAAQAEIETEASDQIWTLDSSTHAYPAMTFTVYRNKVYEAAKNCVGLSGIVAAHALTDPVIFKDLTKLARGDLQTVLVQGGNWSAGQRLDKYWYQFKSLYVGVTDTLVRNYSARSITETICEASLSHTRSFGRANNAAPTVLRNIQYVLTVPSWLKREHPETLGGGISNVLQKRTRPGRNKSERHGMMLALIKNCEQLKPFTFGGEFAAGKSVRKRFPGGKKRSTHREQRPQLQKEVARNRKRRGNIHSADGTVGGFRKRLRTALQSSHHAKAEGLSKLPKEPLVERATKLSKAQLRKDLIRIYPDREAEILSMLKTKYKTQLVGEKNLIDMMVAYWEEQSIEE
jgi:hypothetical protein